MINVFKKIEERISFSRNLESIFLKEPNRKYRIVTKIKNSKDMFNRDQKYRRKRVKELEGRAIEASKFMPRCRGSRGLPAFCLGTWMGPPERFGIQDKEQVWGEYGEFHLRHVEIQVFKGKLGASKRQLRV